MAKITQLILAGSPLIFVKTSEESRCLAEYVQQIKSLKVESADSRTKETYKVFSWNLYEGISELTIEENYLRESLVDVKSAEEESPYAMDPIAPIKYLDGKAPDNSIMLVKDYHKFFSDSCKDSPVHISAIRETIKRFKANGKTLIFISPSAVTVIPKELEVDAKVIDFSLPGKEELTTVIMGLSESTRSKMPKDKELEELLNAAAGMTVIEAEDALSLSLVMESKFNPDIIRKAKAEVVKKTDLLEVVESEVTMADAGGLEIFKDDMESYVDAGTPKAAEYGVEPLKGVLLLGVSGCGKSLSVKAVASLYKRPLLRLSLGKILNKYVGESEGNLIQCLKVAEAVSPAILWVDEIEKDMGGSGNGNETHEVTKKLIGILLNWMQERKADVILMATANSVKALPPELMRSGRISCMYWFDLPEAAQREEILKIYLKKKGRDPDMFGKEITVLVEKCKDFSPADIEEWVKKSVAMAWKRRHKDIMIEDFMDSFSQITPISKLTKDDIAANREWAKAHGCRMASKETESKSASKVTAPRKISSGGGAPINSVGIGG